MKHRVTIAIPIAVLAGLVSALPALAQRGIGAKPGPVGRASSRGSFGTGGGGGFRPAHPMRPMFRGRGRGYGLGLGWGAGWGSGWAYSPYLDYGPYSDYGAYPDYADNGPGMAAPPWANDPRSFEPPQPEKVIQPMVIERQGDQWVKVTGYVEAPAAMQSEAPRTGETAHPETGVANREVTAESPRVIPAAVLVFRDGHQEEVKRYTIIGDTLFAKADYYGSGTWTRQIQIANLDVPATLKLNEERGSNFRLPSGPQEVMIRP
jgi:hypothetical protein